MLNTFILSDDYDECARLLDYRRLGKQRVEAYQILLLLEDLHYIDKTCNRPIETRFPELSTPAHIDRTLAVYFERCSWVNETIKWYKSSHTKQTYITRLLRNGKIRTITLGFSSHPCIKMWIGYEDSLKLYINACIREWFSRGYKNTMEIQSVNGTQLTIQNPWWITRKFMTTHFGALLLKEQIREEPMWYLFQEGDYDETNEQLMNGEYIWPPSLTIAQSHELLS